MQIKIDEDFKNLLPDITTEEYTALEKSIVKYGVLSPLILWNGFLVDGHNRYAICQAHNLSNYQVKEIEFDSKATAMKWILENQSARRNLLKTQLVQAWSKYEAELAKEAAERLSPGTNQYTKRSTSNLMQTTDEKKRNPTVAAEVAKKIGVSENTYRDMKLITEHGTQEQKDRMNKGGRGNGVNAIANEVRDNIPDGMRRCTKCKKILPVSYFYPKRTDCKDCCNKRDRHRSKDIHGKPIHISDEYKGVPDCGIIDGLLDVELPDTTINDVVNEFMANFRNYMSNLIAMLHGHEELVKENGKEIADMWKMADEEFQKVREEYM